ncbi:MAG: hypothetical protein M1539_06980 [Actinobacteria bacterium]|nr:hypothetical protein [Actinomycetota bacterium]MCL5883695.1 hypothetical protein [Actinomycetota bacterium]
MLAGHLRRHGKKYLIFSGLFLLIVINNWSSLRSPLVADDEYFIHASLDPSFVSYPHFFLFANAPYYFRPLVFMVWTLQYVFFGYSGLASHLINVAFQTGIVFLLYRLLTRLRVSQITALLAAALFAITPMAVEVISWSAGRGDCMSVFFILLAMNLFLSYMLKGNRYALGGFVLSAVAALLSKEIGYILLIMIPAMKLLFGGVVEGEALRRGPKPAAAAHAGFGMRLRENFIYSGPWQGVMMLYASFAAVTLMRYLLLGNMGGQYKLYGMPTFQAVSETMVTLLAPLSNIEVSNAKIMLLGIYSGLLVLASIAMVIERWKKAAPLTRRVWIFFAIFFLASFAPVFRRTLSIGINNDLEDSRFLYTTSLAVVALPVLGLLEFGWRSRLWKAAALTALLLLVPAYMFGTREDSILWNQEALVVDNIARETRAELPNPEPDAKLYLDGAPSQVWHYYYGSGLDQAVRIAYGRKDLDVEIVNESPDSPDLNDGYLFVYDDSSGQLDLLRPPRSS